MKFACLGFASMVFAAGLVGCGDSGDERVDAGHLDAGPVGEDGGAADGAMGSDDAGPDDAGEDPADAGGDPSDAGPSDAGAGDSGPSDAGTADAGGGRDDCAHPVCAVGAALEASCSECAAAVCADDDYCCTEEWDDYCVELARAVTSCGCEPAPSSVLPPVCDASVSTVAAVPSGGACGAGFACNPVTNAGCDQAAGEACDNDGLGDFDCYADGNVHGLCGACGEEEGFCTAGYACALGTCLRYCCADADCGEHGWCDTSLYEGALGVCIAR